MKMADRIATICQGVCTCPTSTITLVIEPGPASMGIPSGTMPASSFCAASAASTCASCVGDRFAWSMSSPMSSRITPPAISNAGSVIPNIRKMYRPATANALRTTSAVTDAFHAIFRRRAASAPAVTARNVGSAANGSTRKKMELSASTEKRTYAESSSTAKLTEWDRSSLPILPCRPPAIINDTGLRSARMTLQTTNNIWHNGKLIPWDKAQIHVMSHVVHYGSSVFEGIRCYTQPNGAGVFRLPEHMARLVDSAKIYRMPLPYTVEQLSTAVIDVVEANGVAPCYIRPIAFRGYGELGVNPLTSPVEVYIANYPWGKYVPGTSGADVCVSSWSRLAPNTMPTLAKAGANYMNSQLIRMEAEINGYSEGIGLDTNGYLSEGSGENLFLVRGGVLYTTPLANSVLNGITRSSVLTLARQLGIDVVEQALPREMLYICDEAFFTGTAAEVTHLRSVDRILVGDGTMGPITKALHDEFFGIVHGTLPDRYNWLTPVNVKVAEPVGV